MRPNKTLGTMDNLEKLNQIIAELETSRNKINELPLPHEQDEKYDDAFHFTGEAAYYIRESIYRLHSLISLYHQDNEQ